MNSDSSIQNGIDASPFYPWHNSPLVQPLEIGSQFAKTAYTTCIRTRQKVTSRILSTRKEPVVRSTTTSLSMKAASQNNGSLQTACVHQESGVIMAHVNQDSDIPCFCVSGDSQTPVEGIFETRILLQRDKGQERSS